MKLPAKALGGLMGWILWAGLVLVMVSSVCVARVASGDEAVSFRIIAVKERGEAEDLVQRIKRGEPFWKLAMERSIHPNAFQGGYVEEAHVQDLQEELRLALSRLPPGGVSEIIPLREVFAILEKDPPVSSNGAWSVAEEQYAKALRLGVQGDLASAGDRAQAVLSLYPTHQAARFISRIIAGVNDGSLERPVALQVFEALHLIQEGSSGKALEVLEKASRSAPGVADIQIALGEAYMLQGRIQKAVSAYERALSSPVWGTLGHLYLGAAYLQQGEFATAQSHYEKVVASDMSQALAHLGLGLVHLGMGRVKEAFKEFQVSIAIDPRLDPAWNQLGLVFLSQGRTSDAIWCLEKALSIRPDHPPYLNHLGFAYNQRGMFSKAVSVLEHALTLAPDDPMTHNNLAIAYYDSGEMQRAIFHADRARSLGYQVNRDFLAKLARYRR
ncbi:MAG: tetratricopeptide repeat protein [Thermodesulfobacteriota bacterium]